MCSFFYDKNTCCHAFLFIYAHTSLSFLTSPQDILICLEFTYKKTHLSICIYTNSNSATTIVSKTQLMLAIQIFNNVRKFSY